MKKLLVICGPTATGKTTLAFHLAGKFSGELISVDSRQVYMGMDVGTGKDIPKGFEFRISNLGFKSGEVGYYTDGDTRIWGYDLVSPKDEFSVSKYLSFTEEIIKDIWKRNKLPILVGGTGFYIKALVDGISTSSVPRSKSLRKSLESKKVSELFEILAQIDPVKAASLNISDKRNPRRLIRAIEVGRWKIENKVFLKRKGMKEIADVLFVGTKLAKDKLNKRVEERVEKRIKQGIKSEIKKLLDVGVTWDMQSMEGLGYKQWRDYFEEEKSEEETVEEWKKKEKQYAKRQLTWFKRDKRIVWFNVERNSLKKSVEKLVQKWYKSE